MKYLDEVFGYVFEYLLYTVVMTFFIASIYLTVLTVINFTEGTATMHPVFAAVIFLLMGIASGIYYVDLKSKTIKK